MTEASAGLVPSQGWEGSVCSRPLSLACRWLSPPCVFTVSSFVCDCVQISSSEKDTSQIGLGPT